ncbi:MAG TPA: hypothetical protein VF755_14440 [Catenuloplanes sp.]|jgi:hypothetical protein
MIHHARPDDIAGLLNAAAELAPADLGSDLGEIRRRGRRRNRTRRAATACAGVVTAATIVAGTAAATGTFSGTGGPAGPTQHQVGAPAVPGAGLPTADPSRAVPPANAPAEPPAGMFSGTPIGELIKTDTAHSGGKLTLWFSESAAGDGRLHLSLGARDAKGELRSFGSAVAASRRTAGPGFKAAYGAVNGDSEPRDYALVGIVVGDVARVTLTVDGKPRTAHVATWSEDPRVHAWWVLGDKLDRWPDKSQQLKGEVSNLTAYGPDGKVVARGDDGGVTHG